jgi:uncharacterized protein (DUF362 family)
MNAKVYYGNAPAETGELSKSFEWSGISNLLGKAESVFIKPNLTFPTYRKGVTTTPDMIEGVLSALSDYDIKVFIGESDGGYGSYRVEEAFENFGLPDLSRRFGAKLVDLSAVERVGVPFTSGKKEVLINLPKFLFEENIEILTMPVPKVHCMTGISLSLKNQWGCLPDMMRLRQHVYFDGIISQINKVLNVRYSVVDGTYGLNKNGPIIEGEPVPLGWFLVSSNPLAADSVAAYLIGQDLRMIRHYRAACASGLVPSVESVETNVSPEFLRSKVKQFRLERNFWNYIAKTAWYSKTWNYMVYESAVSKPLHDLMYLFRERPKEFNRSE